MPSSHGGGGSSSGGFHSSSSGSSSSTTLSNRYYPGAHRYHYINRYGTHCYFYSSGLPKRVNLLEFIFVPIMFILFPLLVSIFLASSAIPHKLSPNLCDYKAVTITDKANVIEDEEELSRILNEFYEKTGVQPYVFTETKQDLLDEGYVYGVTGLTDRSYNIYVDELFGDDEGHWLIYFAAEDSEHYKWVDQAGDNTSCVVTDKLFNMFQDKFQESLETNDIETSFVDAFSYVTEKSLSKETIDYTFIFPIIFLTIFLIIGFVTLSQSIKQYKTLKDYNKYKEESNNGVDDIVDEAKEYSSKKDEFHEQESKDYIR